MARRKGCKFEESIAGQIFDTEREYMDFCNNYYNFRVAHNYPLSKEASKHWVECRQPPSPTYEEYLKEEIERLQNKLKEINND